MSFVDVDAPSNYEILDTTPRSTRSTIKTSAIIEMQFDYVGGSTGYKIVVPDAGDESNARALLKMYRKRERETRIAHNEHETVWRESLKEPHLFMRENRDTPQCYCGKLKADEIHVETEDNDF